MSPVQVYCAFIVLFLTLFQSHGQLCIPGPVRNLSVTTARGLSWQPPTESCNATSYLVTIRKEGHPNLLYYVQTTSLNVTFLAICETFQFSVIAVGTDHVQGSETILSAKTPPQGLDLTVDVLNATQTSQDVLLTWKMKTGVEACVDSFRIVLWDEDTVTPSDIYVQGTSLVLSNVVPCMKYEFEIRALIGAEEEGDALYLNYTATAIPSAPPSLGGINLGVTNVNITWNLPAYSANRCPITALIADASPSFNVSFPLVDSSLRPPYTMELIGLQPNTIYLCRIFIINNAGTSAPLAIAIQTQPGVRSNNRFAIVHRQNHQQLLEELFE